MLDIARNIYQITPDSHKVSPLFQRTHFNINMLNIVEAPRGLSKNLGLAEL